MRVTTRITYDMATWDVLEHEFFDYDGPVAECKGDSTAKKVQADEFALQKSQQDLQNKRFAALESNLSPYLSGNIGYSDEGLANMKSSFLNQNAQDFNSAGNSIRDMLTARGGGGDLPTGGGFVRGISGLMGAQATARAGGLQNIALQNAQQKLNNQFNAASVLSGNAAALSSGIGTAASAGSNALSAYIQSKNQGFGAAFTNSLGSSLGKGLGSFATGGFSGMMPTSGG